MNSSNFNVTQDNDGWPIEKQEWLESLVAIQREHGNDKVRELLRALQNQALKAGISLEEATLEHALPQHNPSAETAGLSG